MTSRNLQLSARFVSGSVLIFQMQAVKAHRSGISHINCGLSLAAAGLST